MLSPKAMRLDECRAVRVAALLDAAQLLLYGT